MPRDDLRVQHPRHTVTGLFMAHCCRCGEYVDDWGYEPPVDYLCDDCEERDDA